MSADALFVIRSLRTDTGCTASTLEQQRTPRPAKASTMTNNVLQYPTYAGGL